MAKEDTSETDINTETSTGDSSEGDAKVDEENSPQNDQIQSVLVCALVHAHSVRSCLLTKLC